MKTKQIILSLCILSLIILSACTTKQPIVDPITPPTVIKTPIEYEFTAEGVIKPEMAEKIIKETADKVMTALKEKDMKLLSTYIHPDLGVRFTPYTYVVVEDDLVFTPDQIIDFFKDPQEYVWGSYDGTGFEIRLTPPEYYEKFIYSADFMRAEKIGYNTVLSTGNMLENQFAVYENPIVVEYYFSGFNPEYQGMDWRSLRLAFEEYEGRWVLVGIIHNQWTI